MNIGLRHLSLPFFSLLLLFCAVSTARSASPEPDPYRIYHQHYEATGGLERFKHITTWYSAGRTEHDGLKGRFRLWQKKPLKFRLEEDYGVISQVSGDSGEVAWEQDTNGQVQLVRDPETLKRRKLKALFEDFEHLDRNSEFYRLASAGTGEVNGRTCDVVRMTNTLNRDVVLSCFDRSNHDLLKETSIRPDYEVHTLYSDHRWAEGIRLPFTSESRILPRGKREKSTLEVLRINRPVDEKKFVVPERKERDFRFTGGTKSENIPFRFIENSMYIKVLIQGDSRYWAVDSGASMSVIDADYASRLGLTAQGELKGFGFGDTFDLSFVTLPGLQVGELVFDPQKIYRIEGLAGDRFGLEVVGVLGYDFLSRLVTKIDYAGRRISFYDPETFSYTGSGKKVDAPLTYRTFTVPVVVDGTFSGRWSIDLGSYDSSFHYQYAREHGLLSIQGVEKVSRGLASQYLERTIQMKSLDVGGWTIVNPLLTVPLEKGKGATSIGELAGNLGNSILRNFILYLDYERQQIIIEKGGLFNHPLPRDKSGLTIGQLDEGSFQIAYVAPNSPAARTGLRAGDLILAVDGQNVGSLGGLVAVRNLFREKSGTSYTLTIHRGGKTLPFQLILEDMFP